jgi:hypothetical protein
MFNFFYFVVVKKSKESSEDPANGGCGDKNLTGMAFVNSTRVNGSKVVISIKIYENSSYFPIEIEK